MELRWRAIGAQTELFVVGLVVLVFAAGGSAWGTASDHAILADHLERSATTPLYDLIAGVAAYLPAGEPWFRLAVLNSVLGAALLVGVTRAAQAVLPKDPVAGYLAAVLLVLTPPFRDAAGFGGPAMLTSCGVVWTVVAALAHAREASRSRALAMFAGVMVTIGSAPWLGIGVGAAIGAWQGRRVDQDTLAISIGGIGLVSVLLWLGAEGSLPGIAFDLSAVMASANRGAATIVVGVGLLGILFAAVTGLTSARALLVVMALAGLHAAAIDHEALPLLSLLAIGCAVLPSGVVRAIPSESGSRRHLVAAIVALPLVGAALLTGAAFGVDDPGASPSRVASDLTVALPPGPGIVFAARTPAWSALLYERGVAGARPDLELAPENDVLAVNTLRGGGIVGADTPAFGRLDLRLAYPRGRGFQLLLAAPPEFARAIPPPAQYESEIGEQLSVLAAVERARYEAGNGRLGAAARAAGLTHRFGAGDLAILSTTAPSRPAFFGFIPELDHLPPGPWLLELLGDDLAWSAGLEPPVVDGPRERTLHALWRALWRGEIASDNAQITALGPEAVRATAELMQTFDKKNRR